jgi:D-glycero-alpha-D-manno-heptose-7-phosphate kinase
VIVSRTPYRLSLFGGGTDYPKWFQRHGGAVIGTAIDKYCNISLRRLPPFFSHRYRVVWSRIELVNDLLEIEHPAVRAVLLDQKEKRGLEIHHDGDLPARSGLGSSSAFTVGLLNALYALRGQMISKHALASEAIRMEQSGPNLGRIWRLESHRFPPRRLVRSRAPDRDARAPRRARIDACAVFHRPIAPCVDDGDQTDR